MEQSMEDFDAVALDRLKEETTVSQTGLWVNF